MRFSISSTAGFRACGTLGAGAGGAALAGWVASALGPGAAALAGGGFGWAWVSALGLGGTLGTACGTCGVGIARAFVSQSLAAPGAFAGGGQGPLALGAWGVCVGTAFGA